MGQVPTRHPAALAPATAEASNALVLHFITLRRAIGILGLALPWVLVLGENLRDSLAPHASRAGRQLIELSMSAYFHTGMRDVFVGSLCAIAVFLLAYRGYDRTENGVANVAGLCALLVALFPTPEDSREAADTGTRAPDSVTFFSGPDAPDPALVGYLHFGSAAVFFFILAWMSFYRFTMTDPDDACTRQKEQRNVIYRACGIVIVACIAAIAIGKLFFQEYERVSRFVFWSEAVAVTAFGISWLIKGETLFRDRPPA